MESRAEKRRRGEQVDCSNQFLNESRLSLSLSERGSRSNIAFPAPPLPPSHSSGGGERGSPLGSPPVDQQAAGTVRQTHKQGWLFRS
jgi:hypothetical protein